jgi:hypothetical protein
MDRIRRALIAVTTSLFLSAAALAQVEVGVPASRFRPEERIEAKVVNNSASPVSYCVEVGQWSPHAGTIEATPIPFHVEEQHGGKWSVLMIGPDIGSSRHPVTLDPGSSCTFAFRLLGTGRRRLVLYYWLGERDDVCDESAKGRKTARSQVFSIVKD